MLTHVHSRDGESRAAEAVEAVSHGAGGVVDC